MAATGTGTMAAIGPAGSFNFSLKAEIAALADEVASVVTTLASHTVKINKLADQASDLATSLSTQLTRIGQIQAQLDRLAGTPSQRRDRRSTDQLAE